MTTTIKAHSSDVLYQSRNLWWNEDFVSLLAQRWGLKDYNSMLDVGLGLGHWSRMLLKYVEPSFTFTGLDIEQKWLDESKNIFSNSFPNELSDKFKFIKADAHDIPLPSNSFDIVTCQTVLMHLHNPLKCLSEMKRLIKPTGIVICVEPINLFNRLEVSSLTSEIDIRHRVVLYEFWSRLHEGKRLLKLGDNDIGMYLPGLFEQLKFNNICSFQNDRLQFTSGINVEEELSITEEDRYFAHIGGADSKLQMQIGKVLSEIKEMLKSRPLPNYFSSGTLNMIICSGSKND
ncbi:SAM-dependent methyltransferase [Arcicella rosea]|uniref:class I SAM-dependent methyltransferase n=1 Tax=Arcicella rosea TaxID=502909 RepID=UPI00345CFE4F